MLALGIIGLVGTVVLWLISKRHNQEVNSGDNGNKKLFYTEMILLIAATLFFGGRIVYSAVPYHGALSWKLDEWMRKKEVELEHNNLFEDGVEGILMDLDEALQLPEELYIANKYQVSFDENGTIQRIYAFILGIAPEDLPRIFDRGYTGRNGRTHRQASGIGLYLCRRICRDLGHTITAASAVGEGTVIRLDLSRRTGPLE